PLISEVVLFFIIPEGTLKPFDVLRHGLKRCILKTVDTMHLARKESGRLFDRLALTGPVSSCLVERDPVSDVSYVVVELPITTVPVVETRLLDLGSIGCMPSSGL